MIRALRTNNRQPNGRVARLGRFASAVLAVMAVGINPAWSADMPEYNRDIRPILNENCFACQGQDKSSRKAKLRLDVAEEAVRAGAIVPGKPADSAVIERIFSDDSS